MQEKYNSFRVTQPNWNTLSLQKLKSNSKYAIENKPAVGKRQKEL